MMIDPRNRNKAAMSIQDNHRHDDSADTIKCVEDVLRKLADDYYTGCQQYEAVPQPDSSQRIYWRIRLIAMRDIGEQLADALRITPPDWATMRDFARTDSSTVERGR